MVLPSAEGVREGESSAGDQGPSAGNKYPVGWTSLWFLWQDAASRAINGKNTVGKHDLRYRLLFSQPRMVQELLRGFVEERCIERLDFSTLERVSASYVSQGLRSQGLTNRESDVVWKLRFQDGSLVYIYILLEFQSEVQKFMAVRLMVYLGLLYQDLIARGELSPAGKLPTVLPLVLYNGEEPWWAASELSELIENGGQEADLFLPRLHYRVIDEGRYRGEDLDARRSAVAELFRMERSRERKEVLRGIDRLGEFLQGAEDGELRHAFAVWINDALPGRTGELDIPERLGLEDFRNMLQNRIEEWNRELREEGRQEGLQQVLLQLLEQRFGPLDSQTTSRLKTADAGQLQVWAGRLLNAGSLDEIFADETH